jgi:hypothetical protein
MSSTTRSLAILAFLTAGSCLFAPGCAPSFQGIKYRAQAPPIEEAFRSISLAVTVDGYAVDQVDPAMFTLESGWRALKKSELAADTSASEAVPEGRITLKMVKRGMLYDVLLTPWMRTRAGGTETIAVVPATHPLRIKWEKAITRLIEREARDED